MGVAPPPSPPSAPPARSWVLLSPAERIMNPTSAMPQPAQTPVETTFRPRESSRDKKGVHTTLVWVNREARMELTRCKPMFNNPCAATFQNPNSTADGSNFRIVHGVDNIDGGDGDAFDFNDSPWPSSPSSSPTVRVDLWSFFSVEQVVLLVPVTMVVVVVVVVSCEKKSGAKHRTVNHPLIKLTRGGVNVHFSLSPLS